MHSANLLIFLHLAGMLLAAPLPQANKIGAGVSGALVGFDDLTGYTVENAGASTEVLEEKGTGISALDYPDKNNNANNPGNSSGSGSKKVRRQANKIGAGGSDALVGFDDLTGYTVENLGASTEEVEENGTGASALDYPDANGNPNKPSSKRQLGNIGEGFGSLMDGVDTGAGQGPQNREERAGTLIANEGVAAGNLVPERKRQLGNIGEGFGSLMDGVDTGAGQGPQNREERAGTLIANEGVAAGNLVPEKN